MTFQKKKKKKKKKTFFNLNFTSSSFQVLNLIIWLVFHFLTRCWWHTHSDTPTTHSHTQDTAIAVAVIASLAALSISKPHLNINYSSGVMSKNSLKLREVISASKQLLKLIIFSKKKNFILNVMFVSQSNGPIKTINSYHVTFNEDQKRRREEGGGITPLRWQHNTRRPGYIIPSFPWNIPPPHIHHIQPPPSLLYHTP